MNTTFMERLQEYMTYKGINDSQMTITAELSNGLIGKLRRSGKGMNTVNVEKILSNFTDLSGDWLLTGRGSMLKEHDGRPIAIPTTNRSEGIPLIPISAMAGMFTSERSVLESECEYYNVPGFKGADFLIYIKGDSMQPSFYSGDVVACKRVPLSGLFFQWNKVYVLDTNQGPIIKRIKPGSDNEHIRIVSDNADYDPFEFPISEIYAVALVMGMIRLF